MANGIEPGIDNKPKTHIPHLPAYEVKEIINHPVLDHCVSHMHTLYNRLPPSPITYRQSNSSHIAVS